MEEVVEGMYMINMLFKQVIKLIRLFLAGFNSFLSSYRFIWLLFSYRS